MNTQTLESPEAEQRNRPVAHFRPFAAAVAKRFSAMSKDELFVIDIDGDEIWQAYLAAFPEGTNPIYRVRTDHDGSYDRNFVRSLGNVVAIKSNGSLDTLWGIEGLDYPYNEVCAVLDAKIKAQANVRSIFRTKERTRGYESSVEHLEGGATHRWYHFNAAIQPRHNAASPGEAIGAFNTNLGVYRRGLEELKIDAFDTVLDLIDQNTLYRGAEFKDAVQKLRSLKLEYLATAPRLQPRWLYHTMDQQPKSATLLRNSVIGTLLVELSNGVELEQAVRAYEQKVAPANYRRPTALITQRMVDDAAKTIAELGLEDALQRRFATLADVSVNDILWVNNDVQAKMKDGIAGLLAKDVDKAPTDTKKAVAIGIDAFLKDVLPSVSGIEVLVANKHAGNLVSITAPVHADAPNLFKWNNAFAWSYKGNITDSIKERVKQAGGNVDAALRVSLAWFNHDDLDLHSRSTPYGHVYYGVREGILDVDMNAGMGTSRTPVENQSWKRPANGHYTFGVHQSFKRETTGVGFTIQLVVNDVVEEYSYAKAVPQGATITCFEFDMLNGGMQNLKVSPDLVGGSVSTVMWGINTETFVKVNTLMASPNHWEGNQSGNKHWFFLLDGCVNDEPTRGIYNEFLRPELEKHRKVFEVLGNRTKCEPSVDQLSGLGFSSTQRNTLTVRVKGTKHHGLYAINF